MKRFFLYLVSVMQACAGEYAILDSGFRVYSERHEDLGAITRLHTKDGSVDLPSGQIRAFEQEEHVRPVPPETELQVAVPPAPSFRVPSPLELIDAAAVRHGSRPEFVRSVAAVESAFRIDALSPKGAIGLMQLMPATADDLGVDPRDPAQNAEAGARHLRELLLRYKDTRDPVRLALAAYNAGPGAVERYRDIPPYRETQDYVERVLRRYLRELK